jgi:hypothetical protein
MSRPGPGEPAEGGTRPAARPAAGKVGATRYRAGEGRLAHGAAGEGSDAGRRAGAGEHEHRQGRAPARRSTALRISAARRSTGRRRCRSAIARRRALWSASPCGKCPGRLTGAAGARTARSCERTSCRRRCWGERRLDREEQEEQGVSMPPNSAPVITISIACAPLAGSRQ